MDKRKILFISLWVVIGIMIIINIVILNKEDKSATVKSQTVELLEVFEIDNIENGKNEIVKNNNIEVATKYLSNNNKYELNANVKFDTDKGRMIYIREEYQKVNIYQEEYKISKYEDFNIKIENIMTAFEQKCRSYMNVGEKTDVTEQLYGESNTIGNIPVTESIYNEKRLYSKMYTIEDEINMEKKKYDINFYRSGENIICEFVYYLDNN